MPSKKELEDECNSCSGIQLHLMPLRWKEVLEKNEPEDILISLDQEVVAKMLSNAILILGKIYFSLIVSFVIHFKNFIVNNYLK